MFRPLYWVKRQIYRNNQPGTIARFLNRLFALQYGAAKMARDRDVTIEVRGRSSGRRVTFPVVMADYDGNWYLVSMLGNSANWVQNVRAAHGHAVIRHGDIHEVELVEVPVEKRAPILRRYLDVAPGARPHLPITRRAPLIEFERIAADFPVFRITGLPNKPRA